MPSTWSIEQPIKISVTFVGIGSTYEPLVQMTFFGAEVTRNNKMFRTFLVSFPVSILLGDNCIQNFHLGRYIVGYTVGNLVLRRRGEV